MVYQQIRKGSFVARALNETGLSPEIFDAVAPKRDEIRLRLLTTIIK